MASLLFYIFSALMLVFAIASQEFKNNINRVLSLVVTFFCAAILCVMLNASFIATMLVVVYMGAIAMLFLFVVMMIGDRASDSDLGNRKTLPIFACVIAFVAVLSSIFMSSKPLLFGVQSSLDTLGIGKFIYEENYQSLFFIGLTLLVGLVGAVLLTIEYKTSRTILINSHKSKNKADLVRGEFGSGIDF